MCLEEAGKKVQKIKVTEAEVIAEDLGAQEYSAGHGRYYFSIKYKEVGKSEYNIGYSSYSIDNVFKWLDELFEIVEEETEEATWYAEILNSIADIKMAVERHNVCIRRIAEILDNATKDEQYYFNNLRQKNIDK